MDRHFRRFLLLFARALSAPFINAQVSGPVTPGPLTVEWLCGPGGKLHSDSCFCDFVFVV